MLEPFIEGYNRVVYQAEGFQDNLTVTVQWWGPTLEKRPLQTFEELGEGVYYLDFDFDQEGTWVGLFFENGQKRGMQVYKVVAITLGIVVHKKRK